MTGIMLLKLVTRLFPQGVPTAILQKMPIVIIRAYYKAGLMSKEQNESFAYWQPIWKADQEAKVKRWSE